MNSRRILILGSTGLLGVPLAQSLRGLGNEVLAHGRGGKTSDCAFDLSDRESVHFQLSRLLPHIIINLVALTDVDKCQEQPFLAYLLNVRTVENVVSWMETQQTVPHLIQLSTDHLYEGPGEKKESEITPLNAYAWSKFCAEKIAERVKATCLRTNFVGKSRTPDRVSFSDWIFSTFSNKETVHLYSDVFFSPLSLGSLCSAISKVIEQPIPGTYNLGSHGGMSKADFALAFAKRLSLSNAKSTIIKSGLVRQLTPRPCDMRMDSSLFESTFSMALPSLMEEIDSIGETYEIL